MLTRSVAAKPLAASAHAWSWHGKDGSGHTVATGSYRIRLTGKDSTKHTATVASTATVATAVVSRTGSRQIAGPSGSRAASSGCH